MELIYKYKPCDEHMIAYQNWELPVNIKYPKTLQCDLCDKKVRIGTMVLEVDGCGYYGNTEHYCKKCAKNYLKEEENTYKKILHHIQQILRDY